jgi:hypothetical protein
MKTKQKYWTDYPIVEFGDEPGKKAPLREIQILYYDGDKYITGLVEGVFVSFKRGYVYNVKRHVSCDRRWRSYVLSSSHAEYLSEKNRKGKI